MTQPVQIPAPSRMARIAAVHAAAGFLVANPNLPVPDEFRLTSHNATMAELIDLATAHGVEIQHGATAAWIDIPIMTETLHGVDVTYVLFYGRES